MPKERVCANDEVRPLEPVSDCQNREVKGLALSASYVFDENIERVKALREQQQQFLSSLPEEPSEVISQALEIMHSGGGNYPKGIDDALHFAHALEAMVRSEDIDVEWRLKDAACYFARRLAASMHDAVTELDRMQYVLSNPSRLERKKA